MQTNLANHSAYITSLASDTRSHLTDHLKLNAVYWATTSLNILGNSEGISRQATLDFIQSCAHESGFESRLTKRSDSLNMTGGYSGNLGHDPHLLYTLSAIQVLTSLDSLHLLDVEKTASYIIGLQQPDGSIAGDEWGEIDVRFAYCAVSALSLLNKLNSINTESLTRWLLKCMNDDGAFGSVPGGLRDLIQAKAMLPSFGALWPPWI